MNIKSDKLSSIFKKMPIIFLFAISVLIWAIFGFSILVYRYDFSYSHVENCRNYGAHWNKEYKICDWFYED